MISLISSEASATPMTEATVVFFVRAISTEPERGDGPSEGLREDHLAQALA